ncbi:MAG: hypothetical protein EBS55_12995 [Flavobacteriaceae bacterium]|nr:hypothetical protein [Flavobacteriaceae bacterium]
MKIEFGLSVLSKRETLLGLQLTTHNGIVAKDNGLYSERVVEFSIGIVFAIFTIGFVSIGNKLDIPEMDNVKRAMEAFENEMEK